MRKIISLFVRDYEGTRLVRDEVVPGAEWVIAGEGVATRKWDGSACMVRDSRLFKRYDAKHGKMPPTGFEPSQEPDPETGHWPGWVPVGMGPEDRWHREAFDAPPAVEDTPWLDGTYELVGPKVNGGHDGLTYHTLIPHGHEPLKDAPRRTFHAIAAFLEGVPIEGIVWHHPDGRMVKVKARDFGLRWPRT